MWPRAVTDIGALYREISMVTRAQVIEAGKRVALQEEIVRALGVMNTPTELEAKINASVQLRMAEDKMYKLRTEYRNLFEEWYQAGAPE